MQKIKEEGRLQFSAGQGSWGQLLSPEAQGLILGWRTKIIKPGDVDNNK